MDEYVRDLTNSPDSHHIKEGTHPTSRPGGWCGRTSECSNFLCQSLLGARRPWYRYHPQRTKARGSVSFGSLLVSTHVLILPPKKASSEWDTHPVILSIGDHSSGWKATAGKMREVHKKCTMKMDSKKCKTTQRKGKSGFRRPTYAIGPPTLPPKLPRVRNTPGDP